MHTPSIEVSQGRGAPSPETGEDEDIYDATVKRLPEAEESLRRARERWGGEEAYEVAVDAYIDNASDADVEAFPKKLKDVLQKSGNDALRLFETFGIDPFVPDLEKIDYGTLPDGKPRVVFEPKADQDQNIGGSECDGQITMYYSTPEAKKRFRKKEYNLDGPRDLRFRLKHFLKFGNFGCFAQGLVHEFIHTKQPPDLTNQNLVEAQAYGVSPYANLGLAELTFRLDLMAGKEHPEYDMKKIITKMPEEKYRFLVANVAHARSLSPKRKSELLVNRDALLSIHPPAGDVYIFLTDTIIEALHDIEKLRVLGLNEEAIGEVLNLKGKWDASAHRYSDLEAYIGEEAAKNSWSQENLEDRIMLRKLNKQASHAELLTFTRNFFSDHCASKK